MIKVIKIINKIFFNFTFKKKNKYKKLKIKITKNSPLKSISKPEMKEKIKIDRKFFFSAILKKK